MRKSLLASLLFAACTQGPSYPPPQAPYSSGAYAPSATYGGAQPTQPTQPIGTYDSTYGYDSPTYVDTETPLAGYDVPDVTSFYGELDPYGAWSDDPEYGYVFSPQSQDYVPYTNGHWMYTDYGFTWVSNDPFGWATDHYGRWVWRDRWVWRPDTQWGPAWVHWRVGDNVVGWAPMGYDEQIGYVPEHAWRFVATTHLTARDLPRYYDRSDDRRYIAQTQPLMRYQRHRDRSWVAGPDENLLRRHNVTVQR